MSKRFGRNQKRKLKDEVQRCKDTSNALVRSLAFERSMRQVPHIRTESMVLDIVQGDENHHSVISIQVDPISFIISKKVNLGGLRFLRKFPESLADQFADHIRNELGEYIPELLKNVPDLEVG